MLAPAAMGSAAGVQAGNADQEFAGPAQLRAAQVRPSPRPNAAKHQSRCMKGFSCMPVAAEPLKRLCVLQVLIVCTWQGTPDITCAQVDLLTHLIATPD